VPQELYTIRRCLGRAGASGASQVLQHLSSCMPRPEDSGGPTSPCQCGGARVAFGGVKTLGVRNKRRFEAVPALQGARSPLRPTGYAVYASPILFAGRDRPDSAMDARLATGGWLALTRQGLSPCKRCQAFLGARTLRLSRCRKRKRGTSGRWRQSAAGGCSAGVLPHRAVHTVVVLLAGRLTTPYRAPAPPIGSPYPPERGESGGWSGRAPWPS
jgi:hypothetical protein